MLTGLRTAKHTVWSFLYAASRGLGENPSPLFKYWIWIVTNANSCCAAFTARTVSKNFNTMTPLAVLSDSKSVPSAGLPLTLQRAPVRLCWRGVFDTSADWLSVVKSPKPPQQVAASCWQHLKATHCVLSCCCKIASAGMTQDSPRKESGAENNRTTGGKKNVSARLALKAKGQS